MHSVCFHLNGMTNDLVFTNENLFYMISIALSKMAPKIFVMNLQSKDEWQRKPSVNKNFEETLK